MERVLFSTGNASKFKHATRVCAEYGITVIQKTIGIDEIQGEDPPRVAKDKAHKAFAGVKKPVVVSDDSWAFLGLGGFPGVYMHSMNEWLKPEDFLRLTVPLKNRQVLLTQYLVYQDDSRQKIFKRQKKGVLLKEIRGTSVHASHTIIALDGEYGLSIAEFDASNHNISERQASLIWHDFGKWYSSYVNFDKNT
jgi:non-canonical purine NTP pyrophosphatase (RdgB/HAM1 family)